ncbi:hypothetical protein N7495_001799 [Penicillium taxi]|uniref:uncharacterized protein n=1 Tax=Penicillium taxi TaxID=168475 RepID=UPI002545711D|nr:uncharacterized protein N7495_001799 [Penicillium taxi]KAJ5909117.1 hypothetical protein N7495_001799 [Penicillium taxi]
MADYCWQQQASSGSQWLPENVYYNEQSTMSGQEWQSFPQRRTRVTKPRSASNSPSTTSRRRQSAMNASQYQHSLETALLASAPRNSRPISWHPTPARTRGLSNPTISDNYAHLNMNMNQIPNDLNSNFSVYNDNMMSYPVSAGPPFSPTNYFPVYDQDATMTISQAIPDYMSTMDPEGWSIDMFSINNIPPAATACPSYANVPSPGELSGPSTPDFLPIQQFDEPAPLKKAKSDEELVGMGLYSQPGGTIQSQKGLLGKGLKLEETFKPDDTDDNDDEEDEVQPQAQSLTLNSSFNEFIPVSIPQIPQNMSMPKQATKQALNFLQKSFFFDHDYSRQVAQPNLNQSCMSYGCGWI